MTPDQQRDEAHWKITAAYLASCHAATLESMPKSAPKSERRRQAEICRKASAFMCETRSPLTFGQTAAEIVKATIQRCDNAAEKYDVSPKI